MSDNGKTDSVADISSKYQLYNEIEHILKRPGIYVGSVESITGEQWVYSKGRFVKDELTYNPCLLKMFDEIITNSVDEFIKSGKVKRIDVSYNQLTGQIKVSDDGGIPVVKHSEYGMYIPTMIFSELRTGSNFNDEDRKGGGQNGLGAKLASVFSTATLVETCDGKHVFTQSFSNNLRDISDPTVRKVCADDKAGTTITFTPDYGYLGCKLDAGNIRKIEKRCYDVAACNSGVKVFLNGKNLSAGLSFEKYAGMFVDGEVVVDKGEDFHICLGSNADSEFRFVGFVNGVDVFNGGTHIDYVTNQIVGAVREHIKKKHKIDIKPNNIKQQLFLVMKCNVNAPMFNSQTKEHLTTPVAKYGTEWVPSKAFIKRVLESEVVEKVLNWAMAEEKRRELAKLNQANKKAGNASQLKKIVKFEDAISNHRDECELFLCEGDSALKSISGARDPKTQGVYPLRGKPINVRSVAASKLSTNQEFIDILAITGLAIGKKAKAADVRFGKVVIAADRDNDGCLTGDTRIPLVDGRVIPIADLENEEEFYVWSCTEDGRIVPGRGHSSRVTKQVNKLLHITLDNGEVVKATHNHPFMLRDGIFVRADRLSTGLALMPYGDTWRNVEHVDEVVLDTEIDVWDITVDEYHNFALESGCFVHNSHITGLVINMFYHFWPELVKAGLLYQLVTPLIVATETTGKKRQHEFFNKEDYLAWNEKGIKHSYKFFKGLSTHTTKSIKKYVGDQKYIEPIVYDEDLADQLSMLFDSGRGDARKDWLAVGVDDADI